MTAENSKAGGMPNVEVQQFDGPPVYAPRFVKQDDGVIVDRQLARWFPVDTCPPPTERELWVAFEDPDQDELVMEFAEFSLAGRDQRHWYLIGMSEPIDLRALYWTHGPTLPRSVVNQA